MSMSIVVIVLIVIIIILALWAIATYNKLVSQRNEVKNSWGQIDVQLQRRYDLIPNLVEAVKGYMAHERGTLDDVVKARNAASQAREHIQQAGGPTESSLTELMGAETALKSSVGRIFALAENYPQLRASENMQQLQEELSTTENKVAFARQAYNDTVLSYNNTQQKFPANILAGYFGHHPADLFQVTEEQAKKAPKVSF